MKWFSVSLLSLLVACSSERAFCQESGSPPGQSSVSSLGVCLGIGDFHIRDRYLSPFTFRGVLFASKVFYELKNENDRHTAEVFFSTGGIESGKPGADASQYAGSLSYSYVRIVERFGVGGRPLEFGLGAGLSTFVTYTNFAAVDGGGYLSHSLNLLLRGEYRLEERRSVSVQLSMPTVRIVTRPDNGHHFSEFNNAIDQNFSRGLTKGRLELPWENLVLLGECEYRQSLGASLDLHCSYWFSYAASDRPDPILSMGQYMNRLLVGLVWLL